jgi:glycosyltransferase involved in cell wall biosynthesis
MDRGRLGDIARLPIFRTRVWPTALQLAVKWRQRLIGRTSPAPPSAAGNGNAGGRLSSRFKRYVNSLFELPDKQIGWLIPAFLRAYRLVRSEGIELVVTSSPPRTTALVGLLLTYATRVRLVTDLRDPWFVPYFDDPCFTCLVAESRSAAADRIERWLERKIMERSALVITTTERHALALRKAYPWLPEDRVRVISNGYDAEDLAGLDGAAPASKFTLSYLGTFYLHRSPRPLFEALGELMREGTLSPAEVEVKLIGDVGFTTDGSIDRLVASTGLNGCVRVGAAVSYKESLQAMRESSVLLLFAPNQACSVPAKTFEYLAMHRPILCLAHDGATADLINRTACGVVVPPEDVGAIKSAVARLFAAFKEGRPLGNGFGIAKFERGVLSEQFSRLLSEIS